MHARLSEPEDLDRPAWLPVPPEPIPRRSAAMQAWRMFVRVLSLITGTLAVLSWWGVGLVVVLTVADQNLQKGMYIGAWPGFFAVSLTTATAVLRRWLRQTEELSSANDSSASSKPSTTSDAAGGR